MKIRSVFLLGFAAIGLPGLMVSCWMSARMFEAWRQSAAAVRTAIAMGRLLDATEAIYAERGGILAMARASGDAAGPIGRLAANEAAVVVPALRALRRAGLAETGLASVAAGMADIRKRLGDYVRMPAGARDASVPVALAQAATGLVTRLEADRSTAAAQVQRQNPAIAPATMIAGLGMAMRQAAGNRALRLNVWAAGHRPTAAGLTTMQDEQGQLVMAWRQAQSMVQALGDPPALTAAVLAVQNGYFHVDEPRFRALVRTAVQGGAPPMAYETFLPTTLAALQKLQPLRRAAIDYAAARGRAIANAERGSFAAMLGATLLTLAMGAAAMAVLLRRVIRPMQGLTLAITGIAAGALDDDVPHAGRADEIGAMAQAVAVLRDGSRTARRLAAETAAAQAARLAQAERLRGATGRFQATVAGAMAGAQQAATALHGAAGAVQAMAGETTGQARAIAASAGGAAAAVDGVAAAAEELTASIGEISARMGETSQAVNRAAGQARESAGRVEELAETASRIGEVVRLIEGIAAQTNLLALNATIEAARAGEAGRGFAVVANEVKGLATQTAKATSDIAAQIAAIQDRTQAAVAGIRGVAAQVEGVSAIATGVAAAVEQQLAATGEIARSVQAAALATGEVTQSAARVQGHTGQTSAGTDRMIAQTATVTAELARLRGTVEVFMAEMQAA